MKHVMSDEKPKATFTIDGVEVGIFHISNTALYGIRRIKDHGTVEGLEGLYTDPTRAEKAILRHAQNKTESKGTKASK